MCVYLRWNIIDVKYDLKECSVRSTTHLRVKKSKKNSRILLLLCLNVPEHPSIENYTSCLCFFPSLRTLKKHTNSCTFQTYITRTRNFIRLCKDVKFLLLCTSIQNVFLAYYVSIIITIIIRNEFSSGKTRVKIRRIVSRIMCQRVFIHYIITGHGKFSRYKNADRNRRIRRHNIRPMRHLLLIIFTWSWFKCAAWRKRGQTWQTESRCVNNKMNDANFSNRINMSMCAYFWMAAGNLVTVCFSQL